MTTCDARVIMQVHLSASTASCCAERSVATWHVPNDLPQPGTCRMTGTASRGGLQVLLYLTPLHCQDMLDSVVVSLNGTYAKFIARNPGFQVPPSPLPRALSRAHLCARFQHTLGIQKPCAAAPRGSCTCLLCSLVASLASPPVRRGLSRRPGTAPINQSHPPEVQRSAALRLPGGGGGRGAGHHQHRGPLPGQRADVGHPVLPAAVVRGAPRPPHPPWYASHLAPRASPRASASASAAAHHHCPAARSSEPSAGYTSLLLFSIDVTGSPVAAAICEPSVKS